MPEEVKYRLTLEDLLSGKLHTADAAAKGLENSIMSVGKQLIGLAGLYEGFEFFKSSYESAEKLHQATGQLENTLKNVGERAGITKSEMVEMAEAASHNINATAADMVNAEGALARYQNLNKETFEKTLKLSADLAVVNHASVEETATTLGRILEAPAENMRLLRQMKISLTKDQKELITSLEETGHVAEAQAIIFKALADRGYEGAAATQANIDPMFRFKKTMEETKLEIGETVTKIVEDLQPAMLWLVKHFKDLVEWVQKNFNWLKQLVIALGEAWLAFKAGEIIIPIIEGIGVALEAVAVGGLPAFGAAAMAAMGPIGLLITATTSAIFLINQLRNLQNAGTEKGAERETALAKAKTDEIEQLNKLTEGKSDKEVQTILDSEYAAHEKEREKNMHIYLISSPAKDDEAAKAAANSFYDLAQQETVKENAAKDYKRPVALKADLPKLTPTGTETKGATGPKVVNINVTIGNLIDSFSIKTTNIMESAAQIKEKVAMALVSAVNDSEILIGSQQ